MDTSVRSGPSGLHATLIHGTKFCTWDVQEKVLDWLFIHTKRVRCKFIERFTDVDLLTEPFSLTLILF
jgi:hypothetical protein